MVIIHIIVFNITTDDYYAVCADPVRICMCTNSLPDCINETTVSVFPGQKLKIGAVAVGQRYGIVPSIVTAELLDASGGNSHLGQGKDVQSVGR